MRCDDARYADVFDDGARLPGVPDSSHDALGTFAGLPARSLQEYLPSAGFKSRFSKSRKSSPKVAITLSASSSMVSGTGSELVEAGGRRTILDLDDERSPRVGAGGGMRRGDGVRRRFFDGTFHGLDFLALSPRVCHFFMRCDDGRSRDICGPSGKFA